MNSNIITDTVQTTGTGQETGTAQRVYSGLETVQETVYRTKEEKQSNYRTERIDQAP